MKKSFLVFMSIIMVVTFVGADMVWKPLRVEAAAALILSTNSIPNSVHNITTKYQVTANGVQIPVVDGLHTETVNQGGITRTIKPDYLGYDYATFTAGNGDVEIVISATNAINSISVSPLKLGITPTKVNNYSYKFNLNTKQYLIVSVNGNKLIITRDGPEEYVPTREGYA